MAANNLAGKHKTRFSVVRYGNVIGSRGSVIPHFKKLISDGADKLPITDVEMTRFVIKLQEGVDFVLKCIPNMMGGEIFIPKLPSLRIVDLVTALVGSNNYNIIGIRPGEKLHEVMIPMEESLNCIDMRSFYIIQPMFYWWNNEILKKVIGKTGISVSKSFEYSSNTNNNWHSVEDIKNLLKLEN